MMASSLWVKAVGVHKPHDYKADKMLGHGRAFLSYCAAVVKGLVGAWTHGSHVTFARPRRIGQPNDEGPMAGKFAGEEAITTSC